MVNLETKKMSDMELTEIITEDDIKTLESILLDEDAIAQLAEHFDVPGEEMQA